MEWAIGSSDCIRLSLHSISYKLRVLKLVINLDWLYLHEYQNPFLM